MTWLVRAIYQWGSRQRVRKEWWCPPRQMAASRDDSDRGDRDSERVMIDAAETRVAAARVFYQRSVAAYLNAKSEQERSTLGEVMYFAQMATIEARSNLEGCVHFRALAEERLAGNVTRMPPRLIAAPAVGLPRAA
jgi:hypothetical protein